jgi:hypothetical protein
MTLYPIENAEIETEGECYAEIQTAVTVAFTEEIDAELVDAIQKRIHNEVGMLVSFMLGQSGEGATHDGPIGLLTVSTRALIPSADIVEYYRRLADDLEAMDEPEPRGESPVDVTKHWMEKLREVRAAEATTKEAIENTEKPSPFVYPSGLQAGDRVYLQQDTWLPPVATVQPWQSPWPASTEQIAIGTEAMVDYGVLHVSHIHRAARQGIDLNKTVKDGRVHFS